MNELDDWSKELIRSARGGDDPSPEQKRRLGAVLAGGAAGAGALVGGVAAAKAAGSAFGLKLLAGALLLIAVCASTIPALRSGKQEPPAPARVVNAPPSSAGPEIEQPPAPVLVTPPEPAPSAERSKVVRPPPNVQPSLAEEVALLRQARTALSAGDTAGALELLGEHARRFPRASLALEREGLKVMARCRQNPGAARTTAEKFLARHGDTPIAGAVRESCGLQ